MSVNESKRFVGKNVILTGASSGIGRGIAIRLGSEGATIAIHDVDVAGAEETVKMVEEVGGKAKVFKVDVSRKDQVLKAVEESMAWFDGGRIHCLCCNAGVNRYKPVFDFDNDDWDFIIGVNLTGVWNYNRYVSEIMAKQGGGSICNTASWGSTHTSYMRIPYMASKGGVKMMTQAFAQDLGDYSIRVNAVAPGSIETNMTRPDEDRPGVNSRALVQAMVPLRRYGKPSDIASATAYLLSDDAEYITGATLSVDGGASAGNLVGLPIVPMPKKGHFDEVPWLADLDYVKEYREFCEGKKQAD